MVNDTTFAIMTMALLVGACGCGAHSAPSIVGDPQSPNVGWVIMHGHTGNPNEEFGCQSNPRSDCVVHASRSGSQTLSEVHLYFHPTQVDTTYSGVVRIGFFSAGEAGPGLQIQTTVKPGDMGNYSVVGIVTDKPGQYMLTVDIRAAMSDGAEQQIKEQIPVTVRLAE